MAMSSTSSSPVRPVMRNWEELLEQRIDLLHYAVDQGEHLIPAMFAKDQLSAIDWPATFHEQLRESEPKASGQTSEIMKDLEKRVLETNREMKEDTDRIRENLERVSQNPNQDSPEEFERVLDEGVDQLHRQASKQLDELKHYGKKRVQDLPNKVRGSAIQIFGAAFTAVFSYENNAVTFLNVARDDVESWYQQPQQKIQEFDNLTNRWYEGSRDTIKGWFNTHIQGGGPLAHASRNRHRHHGRRHHRNEADNLSAIKDIATKLQCMGLDSFTIVRKGNGWALEIDSPN
ncbi:uncharacterized protein BKCO1_2500078 [Diplodia corticola]|uniref:Uncharacterized protein n=1 Tax=Diplodia corticola TaxID=236234 RepID=A0A1J9S336_9PEZI|nr:uncharacterized protein BKCO1_2500078 [Diplodia corticola]OJD34045.1 hypothetical protein BKCO1_2500078 [Diplodia corticola]